MSRHCAWCSKRSGPRRDLTWIGFADHDRFKAGGLQELCGEDNYAVLSLPISDYGVFVDT